MRRPRILVVDDEAPARFRLAVDRLRGRLEAPDSTALARELEALLRRVAPPPEFLDRVTIWSQDRGLVVPVERIDHVEAARSHVWVLANGKRYLVRHSIGELAGRLDPAKFKRIHRSHIVRLDAIRELQLWFHGDLKVLLRDGTELMWSRRYRAGEEDPRLLE